MNVCKIIAALSLGLVGLSSQANDRLPTIPSAQYDAAQKQAAADFSAARGVPVFGPFEPLMHSPQMMSQARSMGDYLRYKSAIGSTLSELAILMTARAWTQDYEWYVHRSIAEKAGISRDIIDAIADGRRPIKMSDDEQLVYDFCTELQHNKRVSDTTFAKVDRRFGKKGAVDLTAIIGYYTLLAMELNVAQYQLPADGTRFERFPK